MLFPRFFKATINPYDFYIKVDEENEIFTVRLGSSELQDCASVLVYKDDPFADLQGILYDRLCASNVPLLKHNNGTIKMVLSLLKVTLDVFPHITHFRLTDMSMVDCESIQKSILLSDMYFFLHGMTWYENRFHASPTFHYEYEQLKRAFIQRPALPFDVVWRFMPSDMKGKKKIEKMYKNSASWHEFFRDWHSVHGCIPFMYTYKVQGPTLMGRIYPYMKTLHGSTWIIDVKDIDVGTINVVNIDGSKIPKIQWETGIRPIIRLFGGLGTYLGDDQEL